MIVIFDTTEELSNLAQVPNLKNSQQQVLDYGLELLRQNGGFKTSMKTWFNKPPADLTWSNFKKHFINANTKLIKVRGASLAHTQNLGSINTLTTSYEEILTNIQQDLTSIKSTQMSLI